MPDDIATYLCLDETVLRRLQRKQPPGWASSSTSPRILVLKLIGEITDSSLTDSTNRLLLFVAAAALACAVVWVALYWASTGRFIESTDDAYVGGEVTTISAKVAGFIDAVTVIDNQSVKAGDLLLKLDDRDYRAQLARAEASVAAQRATLANIDADQRMHQAVIEQASADVGGAAAELARAKYDLDRYRTLSNDRIASSQRFEQADADHEKARAADAGHGQRSRLRSASSMSSIRKSSRRKPLLIKRLLSVIWRSSISPTRKFARRSMAWSVTAAREPAPMRWSEPSSWPSSRSAACGLMPTSRKVSCPHPRGPIRRDYCRRDARRQLSGRVVSFAPATGAQFSVIPLENATGNFTKIIQRVPVRIELEGVDAELGKLRPGLSVAVRVDRRHSFTLHQAQK